MLARARGLYKALASAWISEKREKKAESPEIRRILPVSIYVFDDSEQKVEFKTSQINHVPINQIIWNFIVATSYIHDILKNCKKN